MKKKRTISILIVVALVAFLSVCIGIIFGSNTYAPSVTALAEESRETASDESVNDVPDSADQTQKPDSSDNAAGFDLDDFLAFVQKYADEAGIGNEYKKAVEAIRTAASRKQVTLSTVASVVQLAVFVVYLISTNIRNGRLKKQLKEVSEKLDAQIRGTNGLIDESNANGVTGQTTKKAVEQVRKDVRGIEKAIECLLTGFTILTDRFNIGAESKETIKREFNRAAREIEHAAAKEQTDEERKEDTAQ